MLITDIFLNDKSSCGIEYVDYGTNGWLKTKDNEVRQCKCVGVNWIKNENKAVVPRYEWKIGGLKEHQFGSKSRVPSGIIYSSEEYAQHGISGTIYTLPQDGELKNNSKVSLYRYFKDKYNLRDFCFEFSGWNKEFLYIKTYAVQKDHSVNWYNTEFEMSVDKNGFKATIPMLEEGKRFISQDDAYASIKPFKVYTLDDDEDEEIKPKEKVRITIEIECNNMGKIKEFATIVND